MVPDFLLKSSYSKIKKILAVLGTALVSVSPMYAMLPSRIPNYYSDEMLNYRRSFSRFKENSIFESYSKYDLIENFISNDELDGDKLKMSTIQKSYNMMKYYITTERAFGNRIFISRNEYIELPLCDKRLVSKNTVSELIRYISYYPYNGTFLSICEIFHLTLECLLRAGAERLKGLGNMNFNFEDFKEDETNMTFTTFKKCMVKRLERLLETM